MRKVKLYIAMSLDGKIAGPDHDIKWLEELPNPHKTDYGYNDFYKSVDTTIMGNNTYKKIMDMGVKFPYPDTTNYVISNDSSLKNNEYVKYTNDPVQLVRKLKFHKGKDIWLVGGGLLNTVLLNEGLIDELLIFVMPVILGRGISLFENIPNRAEITLLQSATYNSGVCSLTYSVKK